MKAILTIIIFFSINTLVSAQPRPDVCPACVQDTTGGYTSIEDTIKWNPVCNFEFLTKEHLTGIEQNRDTISFFPGYLDKLYEKSGYSRGHCLPFEDLAYRTKTAKASMHLKRNLAPQPQPENIGTKLACENFTRMLAKKYGAIKVYGGTYGSLGSMSGINIPSAYRTLIITPEEKFAYWMDTTGDYIRYTDLEKWCKATPEQLVNNLGFDPEKVIK